jgi:GMP synthase (glutamine-hydrolysing)
MKVHALIHAAFEKAGVVEDWCLKNKYEFKETNSYLKESLPSIDEFDFLVIMGGPQSPRDFERYPYLKNEITLIKQAIDNNKLVLGFCLGAQLIAEALGAPTQSSPEKEVGVFPVQLTEEGRKDPLFVDFPAEFPVIHWHYDMPSLAEGAVLLAASAGCPHQAFRYKSKVYGFQFHMEITKKLAKGLILNCPEDLKASRFTQSVKDFLANDFEAINQKMELILDRLKELSFQTKAA